MTSAGGDTVAVSGAGGLVGSALLKDFKSTGGAARLLRLSRPGGGNGDAVLWDPHGFSIDAERLEGCSAVVHLAGESIAGGRWNAARKLRIQASRIEGTHLLVDGLLRLKRPPKVLVCASAVGYYGDRGDELLTEASPPGTDYLAEVCRGWENEAARASQAGIRVVSLRFGVILAREGGALRKMLPPFKLGAGGPLGTGRQWMSWIHIDDVVAIIRLAMTRDEIRGPVNTVAPAAVTNAEFTRSLARVLHRPAFLPAPAFALRLALGEMADALLLSSQHVVPERLNALGHEFRYPRVETALAQILARA